MRFLSSSALAIAPKLMLAASCSAAEAIVEILKICARPPSRERRPHELAGRRLVWEMWDDRYASATAPRIVTDPPARSIASTADFDAPATWKASFAVRSPTPRIRTPSRGFEHTPAATSDSTVIGADWSSLPT